MTLVIHPTRTVYGLGCSIFDYDSVNKIYRLKGKSFNENLSFAVRDINEIPLYAEVSSKQFGKIKELLKKGNHYTFVLKKKSGLYLNLSKDGEVGIRVLPEIKGLIDRFGPIVTTSANIHGERTPKSLEEIANKIIDFVRANYGLIIKGGCYYRKASIVYDLINDRIKRS